MKNVNLKQFEIFKYKKGIVLVNKESELAFTKEVQQELRLLGGSLLKGTNIEQFKQDNDNWKSVSWLKDTSKRKFPDKKVFWAFIFASYKEPVLESWLKTVKNPKNKVDIHKVTSEHVEKLDQLKAKYSEEKPKKQKKSSKKAESTEAVNDQIQAMQAQMAELMELNKRLMKDNSELKTGK